MFKQLMRRKDTRLEAIAVGVVFLLIMALCLSGRKERIADVTAPVGGPSLQTVRAGSLTFDLIRLEECPVRKIVVAVVRVHGPTRSSSSSPVKDMSALGLELDGGAWTGAADKPIVVPFAGACGSPDQCRVPAGQGLLVLRLRGKPAVRPLPFGFRFAGISVAFSPQRLSLAHPRAAGLVGTIFGR